MGTESGLYLRKSSLGRFSYLEEFQVETRVFFVLLRKRGRFLMVFVSRALYFISHAMASPSGQRE